MSAEEIVDKQIDKERNEKRENKEN